eukprot:2473667-Pyramimonas_sp.AAC.1
MATLRGGLRGPPARHATAEARARTRLLTRAACAGKSAQTTPVSCVAQMDSRVTKESRRRVSRGRCLA